MSDTRPLLASLLLETSHLDLPGVLRHPDTLAVRQLLETVPGARGTIVVGPDYRAVASAYVASAAAVDAEEIELITANCGFAIAYQDDVAAAVKAPVALSSLLLVPMLFRVYGRRLGVVTFDAGQLDEPRRHAAGWPATGPPVVDVQGSAAWRRLASDGQPKLNLSKLRDDLLGAVAPFAQRHRLQALLLECTAMSPFRSDLADRTGARVFDLIGLLEFLLGLPLTEAFEAHGAHKSNSASVSRRSKENHRA